MNQLSEALMVFLKDDSEIDLVSNGSIDVNLDFIKVSNIYKSSGGRESSESSRQLKCSAGVFIHFIADF